MARKHYIQPFWYALADYGSAALAWGLFYFARKALLNEGYSVDYKFWLGTVFIPVGWLLLYGLIGSYRSVYKKSRLSEATNAFVCALIGCTALFFLFLIDDATNHSTYYYTAFFTLLTLHFFLTLLGRLLVLTAAKQQLMKKIVHFNAIIVGSPARAGNVYREAANKLAQEGYEVIGFVATGTERSGAPKELPFLGNTNKLETILAQHAVELVVLAVDKSEQSLLEKLLVQLSEKDVAIKSEAHTLDILSGAVRPVNVFGAMLTDLQTGLMPDWQLNIKRVIDVCVALFSLVVLLPLFLY
ncbi:MAG: hypothetical protein M3Q06_12845, partial [Bacteroidota bacterium]|nr:hypothetical protein [Bacteroidota bacterium]